MCFCTIKNNRVFSLELSSQYTKAISSIQGKRAREREGIENCEFFQDAKARFVDYVNIIKCAIHINYSQSHIFAAFTFSQYLHTLRVTSTRQHINIWGLCFPVDATITTTKSEIWFFRTRKLNIERAAELINCSFFLLLFERRRTLYLGGGMWCCERVRKERDYPAINKNNAHSEHKKFTREEEGKIN